MNVPMFVIQIFIYSIFEIHNYEQFALILLLNYHFDMVLYKKDIIFKKNEYIKVCHSFEFILSLNIIYLLKISRIQVKIRNIR